MSPLKKLLRTLKNLDPLWWYAAEIVAITAVALPVAWELGQRHWPW